MVIDEASIDNKYYNKGLNNLLKKDYEKARFYLQKSIKQYPDEPYAYYQLMRDTLVTRDFKEYQKYADRLQKIANGKYQNDGKYLNYLLKFVDESIEVEPVTINDVKVEETNENAKKINALREAAISRNFQKAQQINASLYANEITVFGLLEKRLFEYIKEKEEQEYSKIIELVISKKYYTAIKEIESIEEKGVHKKTYRYFKKIAYDYLKLKNTGHLRIFYSKRHYNTHYEALDNCDYKAALKLISIYNEDNKINNENSLLHIAISDICFLRKLFKNTHIAEETMKKENIFNEAVSEEHKKLIINGGLVILPIGNIDEQLILAKLYGDNTSFTINDQNGVERVVLKLNDKINEPNLKRAENHYKKHRYTKAIRDFKHVIESDNPFPNYVYTKMGLSYLKLNDNQKALPYLIVANDAIIKSNSEYNLLDLINRVTTYNNTELTQTDTNELKEVNNLEGTNDHNVLLFNKINECIIESRGKISVEEAAREIGIDEYTINIIKLMYAKEFYKQKEHAIGDMFLNSVRSSEYKNDEINKAIDEINSKKRFYRFNNEPKMNLPIYIKPSKGKKK